jgi:hypothetical protein
MINSAAGASVFDGQTQRAFGSLFDILVLSKILLL